MNGARWRGVGLCMVGGSIRLGGMIGRFGWLVIKLVVVTGVVRGFGWCVGVGIWIIGVVC